LPLPYQLTAPLFYVVPPLCQAVVWGFVYNRLPTPELTTIRGREITAYAAALAKQEQLVLDDTPAIDFGVLQLPVDESLTHIGYAGATRSGKSVNIQRTLQSLFREFGNHPNLAARAIVYDAKTSLIPRLVAMGVPAEKIRVLNPFDLRCWAWNLAADIEDPADTINIAAALIPEGSKEFFQPAARDILASEMLAFHLTCPGRWDLRDLLLVNWKLERAEKLLSKTPLTSNALDRYGGDPRTRANILATLRKDLSLLETIAACWHQAGDQRISLTEWRDSDLVLVLGHNDKAKEALNGINRAMIERLTNLLLAGSPDPRRGRTWVILDELREAGKISGLSSLLLRGAEYHVHAVLGFQSVQGLWEVYGENAAGEVMGQTSNLAVFHFGNDRKTADWAADVIGKAQRLEKYRSVSEGRDVSTTTAESSHDRHIYMPEELQFLKPTCPEHGLQGVFLSDHYGVVNAADAGISGAQLFGQMLVAPDPNTPRHAPRPDRHKYLQDWNAADLRRLGFSWGEDDDPLSRVRRL
jgi:type IV secretory pathway TraG/TraD family ATPase VirD4